jgi:hypothetical protein
MKNIIEFLKGLFSTETIQSNLEAYIVAHKPQSVGDIDQLERQFYNRYQNPREGNYL